MLRVAIPAVADGSLNGVWLAALALLALAAFEAVEPLGGAARHLHACSAAAGRLQELMATEPRVQDPVAPVLIPPRAALELRDVSVLLPGADDAAAKASADAAGDGTTVAHDCGACAGDCDGDGAPPTAGAVLDGVSLRLSPGERVVLVGPSGAGKTTLARLAARLIDPDAGSVTLGDVDLRAASGEQVRRNVLTITQDARLFTTTVRENVLLAARGSGASRARAAGDGVAGGDRAARDNGEAGDTEVAAALAAAGLGDWLAALPHGLDTLVGEDGAQLSGGERQRLLLARALISDAPLLVLDEPTAHLDPATARAVLRDLDAAAGDRGLLLITHDPALVPRADRVLELRGGRLTELAGAA